MPHRLMEAVPNLSEGRDLAVVEAAVEAVLGAGAEVLDWSADPDHNRSVLTLLGTPETIEAASVSLARVAAERIDLRRHRGVHPRVGALDVLPFVPLVHASMEDARALAHRVGRAISREVGVPVYYYAQASSPPGRALADLRRGGFETLAAGWPRGREPDALPPAWTHAGAHPTAGAVCVGARDVLLAWNVLIHGVDLGAARGIARAIRAANGGFAGVRALAFRLDRRDAVQISMNVEDLAATDPLEVYRAIETSVASLGGAMGATEVIGLLPDGALRGAAAERLRLGPLGGERVLGARVLEALGARDWAVGDSSK
ncbi:MAG TPA: glutamate formimidoyltransferase [Longimicrobiales bacterium]|nr:glutamate formimidoyltransferase [Longimicrobiales bacterium]